MSSRAMAKKKRGFYCIVNRNTKQCRITENSTECQNKKSASIISTCSGGRTQGIYPKKMKPLPSKASLLMLIETLFTIPKIWE